MVICEVVCVLMMSSFVIDVFLAWRCTWKWHCVLLCLNENRCDRMGGRVIPICHSCYFLWVWFVVSLGSLVLMGLEQKKHSDLWFATEFV